MSNSAYEFFARYPVFTVEEFAARQRSRHSRIGAHKSRYSPIIFARDGFCDCVGAFMRLSRLAWNRRHTSQTHIS